MVELSLTESRHAHQSCRAGSEPALRNISFEIEPGQKIAICGRTGRYDNEPLDLLSHANTPHSGKSSLILAIFRLLDLRSGSILIDSIPISTTPPAFLRSHLNIIPQDPVIVPGSVRLNACPLSLSPSDSEDITIIGALTTVSLWPAIQSRGGLDADISAVPLSHGEKQLFCLARAILARDMSPILVLDEATSNLDHHTDELMQEIIRRDFAGKTIIAVVHKLETVLDFDKVVVLDRGRLVEFDSPGRLIEKEGGAFRGLWDSRK